MKETDFARYLTQFLGVYLPGHLGSKKNTQLSYRDSFSLLLEYCRDEEKIAPEKLMVSQVDRDLILRFLKWLEEVRSCKTTTRNQRLAAIHSFFSFLMVEAPQYIEQSQKVLNIPMKKTDKPPLMYLPLDSVKGLLNQPDRTTTHGRRDAVLLSLLYDTGARVQELVDLKYLQGKAAKAVSYLSWLLPVNYCDSISKELGYHTHRKAGVRCLQTEASNRSPEQGLPIS